jgi:hypothetical protein
MPSTKVKVSSKPLNELHSGQMCETQEIRCPGCGRFLGYQAIMWGIFKIKCTNSKCRQWITIDISSDK